MGNSLIIAQNISKTFVAKGLFSAKKENHVLHHVDLEIYNDETLALVGESGCGKTTLGRIILGLEKPTDGNILFEGENIFSKKEVKKEMRKNMQMVFQDPYASLDPKMKVEEILMEPLLANKVYTNKKEARKKVKELLEIVGLNETHMKRYPYQFSGGQRQRIGIARALALEPAFIACDEPVSALDVSVQAQILNLLKEIQKNRNLSLLFISHDLGVVRYIADRVAIMYLGRICEIGSVEEVYTNPKHPYTEYLLQSVPKMRVPNGDKEDLQQSLQETDEIKVEKREDMCPFYSRCKYHTDICKQKFPEQKKRNETIFFCHHPLA